MKYEMTPDQPSHLKVKENRIQAKQEKNNLKKLYKRVNAKQLYNQQHISL